MTSPRFPVSRRNFLKGCCAAAVASSVPALGWIDPAKAAGSGVQHDVLVYLFLRGGIDGLHLVVPYAGADRTAYEAKRNDLVIPTSRLRRIGSSNWGWHPRAGGAAGDAIGVPNQWLSRLYDQGRVAIIQGAGMSSTVTRSHFDAQAFIEFGTPGNKSGAQGWISRYLANDFDMPSPMLSNAFGFGSTLQTSLYGNSDVISIASGEDFRLDGFHWSWDDTDTGINGHYGAHLRVLPMWQGASALEQSGHAAADALEFMREIDFGLQSGSNTDGYLPGGGAVYPTSGNGVTLGNQLRNIAQLVKLDMGLTVAAVDYGFWDTHESQGMPDPGNPNHYDAFGNLTEGLARALDAFYIDLHAAGLMDRVTVVIQSEFGRRFRPNDSGGTDHGYGNVMLALGNQVNGGFHGSFPGLDDLSLFEGQDVAVTTDFRQIIAEALVKRQGVSGGAIGNIFPGFSYSAGGSGVFKTG
ncbi:MAG: DUF1501 domain-containing protein [Lysobacteraceae bacterium]|nr:DUF1501 domain-containing protein [Rhodanobacteraceae bacterium]HPF73977.1 DUF1501 domain-containing protein [Xanthomonadaceae bacterium]HRY00353.1 DUF1501 domain-containing protein [Xanthomonadaceae bacterium]